MIEPARLYSDDPAYVEMWAGPRDGAVWRLADEQVIVRFPDSPGYEHVYILCAGCWRLEHAGVFST